MKKFSPYIITIIVLAFIAIIIVAANRKMPRRMDERITLREKDKIPYGFAAAKNLSRSIFPNATITTDERSPGYWDDVSLTDSRQAIIIVARNFNADDYEIRQLMRFVENGNYVFIIAQSFSTEMQSAFHFTYAQNGLNSFLGINEDSLQVRLATPYFPSDSLYVYPGRKFESWFENLDSAHAVVLGRNQTYPDFIRMDKGEGSFFIHSAPLAFSNYFILHKNNIHYFEQAMSVIPSNVNKVVWNEFYLVKKDTRSNGNDNDKEPNWLSVLLRYREFRWGFSLLLFLLLLWVLLNSRRKQRMIPDHPAPKNDSLDFVKTMGRLYYDRKDHHNLARKMGIYFLEHVRSTYKLPTHTLDDSFIETLHYKSGYAKEELSEIVSFIQYLQNKRAINENQLIHFHNQLEAFYQNT
jgi:hypothetical protein